MVSTTRKNTTAQDLQLDPRVASAKKLLRRALADHQAKLGVRPPDASLRQPYEQAIKQLGRMRGGNLYYPYIGSGIGRGTLVELADGSVKYDMIGGIGVHVFGHSHPDLVDAAVDAAVRDTVMQGNLQQNTESLTLIETMLRIAKKNGAPLEHCFLTTSGAMANENALKLAFHRHDPADRVLAFEGCFCGRTLTLAQITDRPAYRAGLPRTLAVDYVPFFDADDPGKSSAKAIETLRSHLANHPSRHAAMMIELVQGEGGYHAGGRDFFVELFKVLKAHDVAVIFDEIQTFGRTTEPFAFQHFDLDDHVDIVTVGKMTQVCATLYTPAYKPKPGLISQTFTASTASIMAAQRVLEAFENGGLSGPEGRIARIAKRFADRFGAIADRHPGWIHGPFGLGGMIAFTPFDGSPQTAKTLLNRMFDAGVIAFIAGSKPARIRFLPPMGAIENADVDAVCEILEQTMGGVAESTGDAAWS